MTQSTPNRRALWVLALKGPGLFAGCGTILGYVIKLALGLSSSGASGTAVPGFSFFSLPGLGAAIGGAAGALWMQTRPSYKRMKKNHQEKGSS